VFPLAASKNKKTTPLDFSPEKVVFVNRRIKQLFKEVRGKIKSINNCLQPTNKPLYQDLF
jgi:uncharacterized membrane protein YfbV (UPF0208 family)